MHPNVIKEPRSIKPKDFCKAPQLFNLFYRSSLMNKVVSSDAKGYTFYIKWSPFKKDDLYYVLIQC